MSQWARLFRFLSPEASAEPGRWRSERAPYLDGIMDALSDPTIHTVVLMCSSQVGKSETLLNLIGRMIHLEPCPILLIQPTLDMAETFSKDRLAPMLRDTPALAGLVADARSRDSGNTLLHKQFPGGHITMAGANSPASLASRPIRIVLCDEVDRYPTSAGAEGDPVAIASRRSATFWNRKLVLVSTPTLEGTSRIARAFEQGDRRYYRVPCHACGHAQVLRWGQVRWDRTETGEHRTDTARYYCESCDQTWDDVQRRQAIHAGWWEPTATPSEPGIASFHLWEAYSTWTNLPDMASTFVLASQAPDTLRVWVNCSRGETWDPDEQGGDDEAGLVARLEEYEADPLPERVCLLTAGVDIQGNRGEIEIVGWWRDYESYSIDHVPIFGDPSAPEFWRQMDAALSKVYQHPSGVGLKIAAACIDTGHFTQQVYDFVRPRWGRRIWGIKGVGGGGRAFLAKPTRNNIGKVPIFPLGVDAGKDLVMGRLRLATEGPGYCHFPTRYTAEDMAQYTSERPKVQTRGGVPHRVWVKRPGVRNERLDCRLYATAALGIMRPDLHAFASDMERRMERPVQPSRLAHPTGANSRAGRRVRSSGILGAR